MDLQLNWDLFFLNSGGFSTLMNSTHQVFNEHTYHQYKSTFKLPLIIVEF